MGRRRGSGHVPHIGHSPRRHHHRHWRHLGGLGRQASGSGYGTPSSVNGTEPSPNTREGVRAPRIGYRKLLRTACLRTSQNTLSETVWKIGMGPERGVPKANERVETVPIGRFLAPKKHGREAFGYFPNSFSTHLGE